MKLNPYKGIFLAIEGLDGSGSDKIANKIVRKLAQEYFVVFAKEPTEGKIGRFIKKLIKERGKVAPLTLEYLFAADRAIQMEDRVIPALKEGKIVVSDRCLWSSIAYRSLYFPAHWLLEVNNEFFIPDNTYFIDLSPLDCVRNIQKDEDELALYETEAKLSQIRQGYEWIAQKFGYCFDVIDPEPYQGKLVEEVIRRAKRLAKFPQK
jgi:dTMP kinase